MIVLSHQKLKTLKIKQFCIRKIKNRSKSLLSRILEITKGTPRLLNPIRKTQNVIPQALSRILKITKGTPRRLSPILKIRNATPHRLGCIRKIRKWTPQLLKPILKNQNEITLCFLLNHKNVQLNSSPALLLKREGSKCNFKSPSLSKRGI